MIEVFGAVNASLLLLHAIHSFEWMLWHLILSPQYYQIRLCIPTNRGKSLPSHQRFFIVITNEDYRIRKFSYILIYFSILNDFSFDTYLTGAIDRK